MSRAVRLYERLDRLEAELRAALVPILERAAAGKHDSIFTTTRFNPFPELRWSTCRETEALLLLADDILKLLCKLGEPTNTSVASRLLFYCEKWGDLSDHHRGTAQTLARQFLAELSS